MAVYFDHNVRNPYPGVTTCVAWHGVHPLLAVGTRDDESEGFIHVFNEEGEAVEDANIQRAYPVTACSWHPSRKVVATGWESGEILLWNEHDHELVETPHVHKTEITLLFWTSNGARLISADQNGLLVVWKCDAKGKIQQAPVCQHDLKHSLNQYEFRQPSSQDPNVDIAGLAKAAVSGDESALDMFSWHKGNKTGSKPSGADGLSFYVGGEEGTLYFVAENGKCTPVANCEGAIRAILTHEGKDVLVVVTLSLVMFQYQMGSDGSLTELMKVKLSGKSQDSCIIWAGKGLLATVSGENVIRMWDLEKDDNYILSLQGVEGYSTHEILTCIAYCTEKGVLAAGTSEGRIVMWKLNPSYTIQEPDKRWKMLPSSFLDGNIGGMKWGSSKQLLVVDKITDVFVYQEQQMNSCFKSQVSAIQVAPSQLAVDCFETSHHHEIKTEIQIKGVTVSKESVAVWNGKKMYVYELIRENGMVKNCGEFFTESMIAALYEQNLYTIEPGHIQVRNFQGTVKQLINLSETEGDALCLDVNGHFLVVATTNGFIKLFDLSRREAKQACKPQDMSQDVPGFGSIICAKANSTGAKIAIIVKKINGVPDPKLYVWDVEMDVLNTFDFYSGEGDDEEALHANADMVNTPPNAQSSVKVSGRFPVSLFWDPKDERLLCCETKLMTNKKSMDKISKRVSSISIYKEQTEELADVMIVSMLSTPESGVLVQDSFPMDDVYHCLLGVLVPSFYFVRMVGESVMDETGSDTVRLTTSQVAQVTMRDFVGIEKREKAVCEAMMNFSYYITIGNMDEAFKAIKLIKSGSVWENMARMCVKTKRLDVARVCLGNMGHARGAQALRDLGKYQELDAKVAVLAAHLGMQSDAERLLKEAKRYDLLNEFYQNSGDWAKAMETAELHDRIHLRSTYYNYAKHLEAKGDLHSAIPNYEKSDTYRFEVPRMLMDEPNILEAYVTRTTDMELRKWWAQYLESIGKMENALQFYESAKDHLATVRINCFLGQIDKASALATSTEDTAACYHIARYYENQGDVKQAVNFYTRALAYGNAIRLCKEHGLEDQLMNLALLSTPQDMIEAAKYYEEQPYSQDKAVLLYHKAGHLSKALEISFNSEQYGALDLVSQELDENTDPVLLSKCADFFMEHRQFDRAVELLVIAKKYREALELCTQHNVIISEDLAEKMTIPKDAGYDNGVRIQLLESVADCCMEQGQYHLATKKYTQAGNRIKAMRALLKSGDTEKVVFFAGVSRQKEVYILAANYLQSLNWRQDPEIMKHIIGFYTKGKAMDLLAGFYDACAQVEIDEYQNYDKAIGALSEAYKCISKAKMPNPAQQEQRVQEIKQKIALVKRFLHVKQTYSNNSDDAIKQCMILLDEPDLNIAVRIGDVYGLIIEHYASHKDYKQAYAYIEELRRKVPTAQLTFYISPESLQVIHQSLGVPLPKNAMAPTTQNGVNHGEMGQSDEEGEVIDEEVADDMDDY